MFKLFNFFYTILHESLVALSIGYESYLLYYSMQLMIKHNTQIK